MEEHVRSRSLARSLFSLSLVLYLDISLFLFISFGRPLAQSLTQEDEAEEEKGYQLAQCSLMKCSECDAVERHKGGHVT